MTKIGFIGAGNMAGAIVKGITESAFVPANDIYVYNIHMEGAKKMAQRYGINACETLNALIDQADYIVLSIKPQVMPTVLNDLKTMISGKKKVLVSIAAGITLDGISQHLTTDNTQGIIRVMPNLNVSTLAGASAVAGNEFVNADQIDFVQAMFNTLGKAWILDEKHFSTFTALAGSMPAYVFLFIDSIARAGVKHGLPKNMADEIATQAVLGSAQTLQSGSDSAWTMIDKVSSPGGTTVSGLLTLMETGFVSDVVAGIDATIEKDQALK